MSPNPGNRRDPPNFSRMVEQYKKELMQYQRLQPQSIERGAPAPSGAKTASSSEAVPVLRQQPPDPPSSSTPSAQPAASSPLPADPAPPRQRPATDQQLAQQHLQEPAPSPAPQPPPPAPAPVQQQQAPSPPSQQEQAPSPPPQRGTRPSGWAPGHGSWGQMPAATPFSSPGWSDIQLDLREPSPSPSGSCTGTGCGAYLKSEARAAAAQEQWAALLEQRQEQEQIQQFSQQTEFIAQGEPASPGPEQVDRRGRERPATNERWQEGPEQVEWHGERAPREPAALPSMAPLSASPPPAAVQPEPIDRRGDVGDTEPPIGWMRPAPSEPNPAAGRVSLPQEGPGQIDRRGDVGDTEPPIGWMRPAPSEPNPTAGRVSLPQEGPEQIDRHGSPLPERPSSGVPIPLSVPSEPTPPLAVPASASPYQAISSLMEQAVQKAEKAAAQKPSGKRGEPAKRPPELPAPQDNCPPVLEPAAPSRVFPTEGPPAELTRFTDSQGVPVESDQNSLTLGRNGPTLLTDTYLLEKLAHFDRERIPERVVHAKGTGAFGEFESYGVAAPYTSAAFLQKKGQRTPVFVRFSTVVGGRGSPDTVRDPRGFATKFYTSQGNFDLVGNSLPVFFIRDAIQFPDVIHSLKPDPVSNVTRLERFWDFISLTPEATHMITWLYSDRGTISSYRYIDGFSVNTYVLATAQGKRWYAKFQWVSQQGIRTIDRHEAKLLAGSDPDIAVKDLRCAIEEKDYPKYELCIQVMEPEKAEQLEFDPLDDTKTWDTRRFPLIPLGMMTLNRNPDNFFAQVEQAAFCPANRVPGIEFSDDKMLTGRTFSYRDAQRYRIGANFAQLPINRPQTPPANYQQDGAMAFGYHTGPVNYYPNSLAQGMPEPDSSLSQPGPYAQGEVSRQPISKTNDFQQAGALFEQFSPVEQQHLIGNLAAELKDCPEEIRERVLSYLSKANAQYGARVRAALWE